MFSNTIIGSDAFTEMPLTAQALYFHLAMLADDDGFINSPKKIQRMVGASDDDLKALNESRFILSFDSGVVVIKHWKIHNYIRKDRKKDTNYFKEMAVLIEKENGIYSLKNNEKLPEDSKTETARQKAYKESSLPYSFEYKIKQAFWGEKCPVCDCKMQTTTDECGIGSDIHKPTIQHNKPISKGGKHELGNISVICHQCNVSLQATETGELNAAEVIKKWDDICMSVKCQSSDSQVTDNCPHRLGEDRIGEYRIGQESIGEDSEPQNTTTPSSSYGKFNNVILSDNELETLKKDFPDDFDKRIEKLSAYMHSTGKTYKNHLATIQYWAEQDKEKQNNEKQTTSGQSGSNPFLAMAMDKGLI